MAYEDVPNRGPQLIAVYVGMVVPATIVTTIRLVWRHYNPPGLGLDDLCIAIALVLDWLHTGLGLASVTYGFGRHAVDIPTGNLHKALLLFWTFQIVYKMLVAFTKLAVIFLYLRIFPQKTFQNVGKMTAAIILVGSVAFAIASVFQCHPIQKAWNRTVPGSCFTIGPYWFSYAAFNTTADVFILGMPLPTIRGLQLPRPQKAGIMAVFLCGVFVCFTSVMRIVALPEAEKTTEPTWGNVTASIWAEIEGGTGILCACLPSLRGPVVTVYRMVVPRRGMDSRGYQRTDKQSRSGTGKLDASAGNSWCMSSIAGQDAKSKRKSQDMIVGIVKTTEVSVSEV